MVQAGTQSRANPGPDRGVAWVRAGNLGQIYATPGDCATSRGYRSARWAMARFRPGGLRSVERSGAAQAAHPQNLHYDWHWICDYGNGDLGNQGIHEMDLARWFLGYSAVSPRVMSIGGRLGYDDDAETPTRNSSITITTARRCCSRSAACRRPGSTRAARTSGPTTWTCRRASPGPAASA